MPAKPLLMFLASPVSCFPQRVTMGSGTGVNVLDLSHLCGSENLKINKHQIVSSDNLFILFSFKTLGPWNPSVKFFFKK